MLRTEVLKSLGPPADALRSELDALATAAGYPAIT
jgi:hypothetical protein